MLCKMRRASAGAVESPGREAPSRVKNPESKSEGHIFAGAFGSPGTLLLLCLGQIQQQRRRPAHAARLAQIAANQLSQALFEGQNTPRFQ